MGTVEGVAMQGKRKMSFAVAYGKGVCTKDDAVAKVRAHMIEVQQEGLFKVTGIWNYPDIKSYNQGKGEEIPLTINQGG